MIRGRWFLERGSRLRLASQVLVAAAIAIGPWSATTRASSEDCAACHEETVKRFAATPHGKAAAGKGPVAAPDCESCHGPGTEHIEGSGDTTKILQPLKGDAEKADASCLSCHGNQAEQVHWQGSPHEGAGVRCATCHSQHGEKTQRHSSVAKTSRATETCLGCHTAHRKDLTQRSRHPLSEGKMDCTSCHNPHGTASEHLVRTDSVNDLCFSCHAEKRGPFLWEHSPVREDCLTCHTPHSSNHDKLLAARPVQICQSCHLQGRHQTVAGTQSGFWNVNRQCVNCHSQIHGSNHPSGPLFQR
jgi:DmsE family decaheme c-type cytochrome